MKAHVDTDLVIRVLCTDRGQHKSAALTRIAVADGKWFDHRHATRELRGLPSNHPPTITHGSPVRLNCRRRDCTGAMHLLWPKAVVVLRWCADQNVTALDVSLPWSDIIPQIDSDPATIATQIKVITETWSQS